jgi:hypothetical protein
MLYQSCGFHYSALGDQFARSETDPLFPLSLLAGHLSRSTRSQIASRRGPIDPRTISAQKALGCSSLLPFRSLRNRPRHDWSVLLDIAPITIPPTLDMPDFQTRLPTECTQGILSQSAPRALRPAVCRPGLVRSSRCSTARSRLTPSPRWMGRSAPPDCSRLANQLLHPR